MTATIIVAMASRASAHCSATTVQAYIAKAADAGRTADSDPAVGEQLLREVYRDVSYCIDTAGGDKQQLVTIGFLREDIEIDVAIALARQRRFSDAREVLRTVQRRLSSFTRDARGNPAALAYIETYRVRATKLDTLVHRAQGLSSMKAAGDDPLRALAPSTPSPTAAPAPDRTQAPLTCARPNVNATAIRAVDPELPPMAAQQGIGGIVQVAVQLDDGSHVIGAMIQSSPSVLLNAAALDAAKRSIFQTEIRDCKPIASKYVLTVSFFGQ